MFYLCEWQLRRRTKLTLWICDGTDGKELKRPILRDSVTLTIMDWYVSDQIYRANTSFGYQKKVCLLSANHLYTYYVVQVSASNLHSSLFCNDVIRTFAKSDKHEQDLAKSNLNFLEGCDDKRRDLFKTFRCARRGQRWVGPLVLDVDDPISAAGSRFSPSGRQGLDWRATQVHPWSCAYGT